MGIRELAVARRGRGRSRLGGASDSGGSVGAGFVGGDGTAVEVQELGCQSQVGWASARVGVYGGSGAGIGSSRSAVSRRVVIGWGGFTGGEDDGCGDWISACPELGSGYGGLEQACEGLRGIDKARSRCARWAGDWTVHVVRETREAWPIRRADRPWAEDG